MAAVLGIDIGGTKIAAGVVDRDGAVLSFATTPTPADSAQGMRDLVALCQSVLAGHEVDLVGIGSFGPLDVDKGDIVCPPTAPTWRDVPVVRTVADAFGLPVYFANDATAAAVGEWMWGAGKGHTDVLYLTISTGIGGGAVVRDRVFMGATGNGGEMGHVTVDRPGRLCGCGRHGCLEAHCSGTNIAATARDAIAAGQITSLSGLAKVTSADVAAAAAAGDDLAMRIWDDAMVLLGTGITSLINIFEPSIVVLGGGVTGTGDQLLLPVRRTVDEQRFSGAPRTSAVVLSGYGAQVGVIGAAATALHLHD